MNIDLGRVTPIYRGSYDAAESYELNDIVLYTDGNLYWHTKPEATVGVAPTVAAAWTLAFSGDDVSAAIEQIKEDAEAIALGTRGGEPVDSSDPYYHNNAAWYASQAANSATEANNAKVAAQGAQGAAETARDTSAQWATGGSSGTPSGTNNAKYFSEQSAGSAAAAAGSAQDAEAWAAGTRGGDPVPSGDPQYENNAKYWADEAAQSAATFETDPTLSIAGKAADAKATGEAIRYVALREEEDRQILLGSVAQAVQDEYDELRAAPIHTAITIDGNVYPRMDNTRLGLDTLKGRTVAWNQLLSNITAATTGWLANNATFSSVDGVLTMTASARNGYITNSVIGGKYVAGHKFILSAQIKLTTATASVKLSSWSSGMGEPYANTEATTAWQTVFLVTSPTTTGSGNLSIVDSRESGWDAIKVKNIMEIDLTAMYNGALDSMSDADIIAYCKQRLDLDYYAYNEGTLTAPVVSGWEVTGFNQWDEQWELGTLNLSTGANQPSAGNIRSKNYVPVFPGTAYYVEMPSAVQSDGIYMCWYDADNGFISAALANTANGLIKNSPARAHYVRFYAPASYGTTYKNDICINLSSSRNGEYRPYQHSALSIPSTTLNGVGSAQDYIEAVEVGENDYKLVKTSVIGTVEFDGDETWTKDDNKKYFISPASVVSNAKQTNWWSASFANTAICKYDGVTYTDMDNGSYGFTFANGAVRVKVAACDDMTAAQFETWLSSNPLTIAYELATPSQTVIAEHLTLAEVSALAENGGVVSIVNSNGHIVQPDAVFDSVVSRSAS